MTIGGDVRHDAILHVVGWVRVGYQRSHGSEGRGIFPGGLVLRGAPGMMILARLREARMHGKRIVNQL